MAKDFIQVKMQTPNIQRNVDNLERSGGLFAFLGWTKLRPQVQRGALSRIFLKGGLCGKCLGLFADRQADWRRAG